MANVNGFGMGPEWAQNGCGMGTPLDGRGDKTQKKIGRDRAERARTGAIHSKHVDGCDESGLDMQILYLEGLLSPYSPML